MNPSPTAEKTLIRTAKSGAEVLCVENLATASLVQPEVEGRRWAESQRKRLKWLRPGEPIVVLGVGSGFHLRALFEMLTESSFDRTEPQGPFIAVDTCRASIDFARPRCPSIRFQHAIADDTFFDAAETQSWLLQSYTLLAHRPTLARAGANLQSIEELLLGRSPEAFSRQLRSRPQVAAALNPNRSKDLAVARRLSIRDLSKVWDISSETKTDRRIFRVLEELVR